MQATHAGTITRLKEALAKRPGVHCAVMLDTKGPEIRTGFFAPPNDGGKIALKAGAALTLTTDYGHKSDGTKLACTSFPPASPLTGEIPSRDGHRSNGKGTTSSPGASSPGTRS